MPWFKIDVHLFVDAATKDKAEELGQEIAITAASQHRKQPIIMAAFEAETPDADAQAFIDGCLKQDAKDKADVPTDHRSLDAHSGEAEKRGEVLRFVPGRVR